MVIDRGEVLEMIRREIRKHETDLDRAKKRNGVSPEELLKLREKIEGKKWLLETFMRLEQENETYRRVLREKLIEIQRLKLDAKNSKREEHTA